MDNKSSTILGAVIIILLFLVGIFYFSNRTPATTDPNLPDLTNGTPQNTSDNPTNNPQTPESNQPITRDPNAPIAVTGITAFPTDTTVTITGGAIPNGVATNYWFEYGTTVSVSSKTPAQSIGTGYTQIPTPITISGLRSETKYYYQLVAQNQLGKVTGIQYSFQTTKGTVARVGSIPTVRTTSANGISNTQANLNGAVDPNKDTTMYWFEYGKTNDLGETTAIASVGSGTASKPVSVTASNLDSGTTYYYRINAQNDFGTVNGKILTFKTGGKRP